MYRFEWRCHEDINNSR